MHSSCPFRAGAGKGEEVYPLTNDTYSVYHLDRHTEGMQYLYVQLYLSILTILDKIWGNEVLFYVNEARNVRAS